MAAGLLMVVVVFLAIQVDDDIAEFLGYFDFNSLSRELVPDFHKNSSVFDFSRNGGSTAAKMGAETRPQPR